MSIGNNIKNIRIENRLTQKELAAIAGVTDKAVSMWEMDRREPRMGAIQRIADHFGIAKSEIIDEPPFGGILSKNSVAIPLADRVRADGSVVYAKDTHRYDISRKNKSLPTKYVYLCVKDNSMAPIIQENDIILVELTDKVNDKYALVTVDGQDGIIRQFIKNKTSVELISDNPYYPKQVFTDKEVSRVRILGAVKKMERFF